jgi:hypothetical protein
MTADPIAGKREAEMTLDELARTLTPKASSTASGSKKPFDALVLSHDEVKEVQAALQQDDLHPLRRLFLEAAAEESNPMDFECEDRGTWKGSWPLPSRPQLQAMKAVGTMLPRGEQEAMAVQTARKEYKWRDMTPEAKAEFREAAQKGWQTWVDNDAVEVLSPDGAKRVRENLKQCNKSHLILRPRYVYTDKNDGLRTEERQLPLKASARLVVPGYKDVSAYEVRKDAPTASRTSVHLLLVFTASKGPWGCFPNRDKAGIERLGLAGVFGGGFSYCRSSRSARNTSGFPGYLRHLRAQRMKERQGSPPLNFPLLVHGGGDDNTDEENSDNDNEHDGYDMM